MADGWGDAPWGDSPWGGEGASGELPQWIPGVQITITVDTDVRILNGDGSDSGAGVVDWDSETNGGHRSATFQILESERLAHPEVYRYGARIEMAVAPGELDEGRALWTGYLLTPTTDDDGVLATCVGTGYVQLIREREDPLLWQTVNTADWFSTDEDPAGGAFRNDNSIQETIGKARLSWRIVKGQEITDLDAAKIAWWFDDVNATRVAGTINKRATVPTGPAYHLKLMSYDGPHDFASEIQEATYTVALGSGNDDDEFDTTLDDPKPMVAFLLERNGTPGGGDTSVSWIVWITDLRVNGDAYQQGRTPDDSYYMHEPIYDMSHLLGFSTGGVMTHLENCLPLWHQAGPWSDLFDSLAKQIGGSGGWKWGVWDLNVGVPNIDFSNWVTNNTTWTTNAFTDAATTTCAVDPVTQDLYSKVVVTYRLVHSPRLRRAVVDVSPDPFAGLDSWMTTRQRVYRYHLDEPQRASPISGESTLANVIARNIAGALGEEQFSGTIEAAYLTDGFGEHPAMLARAGDRITVQDYPGGAHTFRIQRVQNGAGKLTTLTIGDAPRDIRGVIQHQLRLARHRRLHMSHV